MTIRLLVFEDSSAKLKSFEKLLSLKLQTELNYSLEIVNRTDEDLLESDLMTNSFNFILIDDDLGDLWGNDVISNIVGITDNTPEVKNTPKIYYSSGTPVSELKEKIKHFGGGIACITFEELEDYVFRLIKSL